MRQQFFSSSKNQEILNYFISVIKRNPKSKTFPLAVHQKNGTRNHVSRAALFHWLKRDIFLSKVAPINLVVSQRARPHARFLAIFYFNLLQEDLQLRWRISCYCSCKPEAIFYGTKIASVHKKNHRKKPQGVEENDIWILDTSLI